MRAVLALLLLAAAAAWLAGCPHPGPAPVPPPSLLDGPASCSSACARARELGCAYARPTPEGRTCEDVCTAFLELEPFDLECRSRALSCAAAERCER